MPFLSWYRELPKLNIHNFTIKTVYYSASITGLLAQIRRYNLSGKINVIQTMEFFFMPLLKMSFSLWQARYSIPNYIWLIENRTVVRRAFNGMYTFTGLFLYSLNLLRSSKMQDILKYQKYLMHEGDVKQSWNSLLLWPLVLIAVRKIVRDFDGFKKIQPKDRDSTRKIVLHVYHILRYIDISINLIFIGSSLFLYEGECKRIFKYIKIGRHHEAMDLNDQLVKNFKEFAKLYKYEILNISLFHVIWLIEMVSQNVEKVMILAKIITKHFLIDEMTPSLMTTFGRFIYMGMAASALQVQRDEIFDELLSLKMKKLLGNYRRRPLQEFGHDQIDVWIENFRLNPFDLSAAGLFSINRGTISSVIEIVLSYVVLVSSYLYYTRPRYFDQKY